MNNNKADLSGSIAIIGIGCIFPKAFGVDEFWRVLYHGEDCIEQIPGSHWFASDYSLDKEDHVYCNRGGFISPVLFDSTEFGIPPKALQSTDTSQILGLVAAKMALDDAGYSNRSGKKFNKEKTSVILGVTGTQELVIPLGARLDYPKWEKALKASGIGEKKAGEILKRILDLYPKWDENSFPGLLGNVVSGRIASRLDLKGTNCVVDAACASSLAAINLSIMELNSNRSDMVVSGGVDTLNDIFMHMCFTKSLVMSKTGDVRPFSEKADGTVLGEGVGMVVLKRLCDAEKAGDRIYAVIKGIGASSDGRSQSIYAPRAEGQIKALSIAYESANVSPGSIQMVETHGTGTKIGDQVEFKALSAVFGANSKNGNGNRKNYCALGSVKSMIGHTKAAAGAAGLIKTALSIYHRVIPPTLKVDKPDSKLNISESPFYLNTKARPWFMAKNKVKRAGVSAFGFGGSNFHVLLEEHENKQEPEFINNRIDILSFSAGDKDELLNRINAFIDFVKTKPDFNELVLRIKTERDLFNCCHSKKTVIVIDHSSPIEEIETLISDSIKKTCNKSPDLSQNNSLIFTDTNEESGKLAFMFPGQASQYPDMGKDLVCCFKSAYEKISLFNHGFSDTHLLSDYIYPESNISIKSAQKKLNNTQIAQPAIGAVSAAMKTLLDDYKITPHACFGHSFGEISALWAAGRIDFDSYVTLSVKRGSLMAALKGNGGMTAVKASFPVIEGVILKNNIELSIANINSSDQVVISGKISEIEKAEKIFTGLKLYFIRLKVSGAFHSPLMKKAVKSFAKVVEGIKFRPSDIKVFSNSSGLYYPDDEKQAKSILKKHLVNPVDFVTQVENLYTEGVRTFIETGPGSILSGLVKSILKDRGCTVLSIDSAVHRQTGVLSFACLISKLAASGYNVDLSRWNTIFKKPVKQKMSIPVTGANYKPVPAVEPDIKNEKEDNCLCKNRDNKKPDKSDKYSNTIKQNKKNMEENTRNSSDIMNQTLKVVSEGLKSVQIIQANTVSAHEKFLDIQAEASKVIQKILESAKNTGTVFAESAEGSAQAKKHYQHDENIFIPEVKMAVNNSFDSYQKYAENNINLKTDVRYNEKDENSNVNYTDKFFDGSAENMGVNNSLDIVKTLISIVSELTGYPEDALGLDMDMESDLGIDSIKRVEIFSALEEKACNLPEILPDTMSTLKTLGAVIDYINENQKSDEDTVSDTKRVDIKYNLDTTLISIVSELTGYPEDALGLDMDMESDLGIDSIKRVEIFSALEEKTCNLPEILPDIMSTLKTLGAVIDYINENQKSDGDTVSDTKRVDIKYNLDTTLISIVSELTGYPEDALGLDMDMESDLGIDSIKRVEIFSALEEKVCNLPEILPDTMSTLKTLGAVIDYIDKSSKKGTLSTGSDLSHDSAKLITQTLLQKKQIPAHGDDTYLSSSTVYKRILKTVDLTDQRKDDVFIPKGKIIYVTDDETGLSKAIVKRLVGKKIDAKLINSPSTGFKKYYRDNIKNPGGIIVVTRQSILEKTEIDLKDINYIKSIFTLVQTAGVLFAGQKDGKSIFTVITRMDGSFGINGNSIFNPVQAGPLGLCKTAALEWENTCCHCMDIEPNWLDFSTIAESVVSEIFKTGNLEIGISENFKKILRLENRSFSEKTTDLTEKDVIVVTGGARGITAECAVEIAKTSRATMILLGRSPMPFDEPFWLKDLKTESEIKKAVYQNCFTQEKPAVKQVEKEYRKFAANREIQKTIDKIKSFGSKVVYYQSDIINFNKLSFLMEIIRNKFGHITAVIHGAGVLHDKLIIDKTLDQLEMVFNTKVTGFVNLLENLKKDPIKHLVFFSSVSARFGNKGQSDYAMANEILNKIAQVQAQKRADCKVTSINWGPWDGGMVTTSIKREFEKNNINVIPVDTGVQCIVKELVSDYNMPVEVVIDAGYKNAGKELFQGEDGFESEDEFYEKNIQLDNYFVLKDHVLGKKPVVPLSLVSEWIGSCALHENPGMTFLGFDNLRVLNGIKMGNGYNKSVWVVANKGCYNGSLFEVDVRIKNSPNGNSSRIFSSAKAILKSNSQYSDKLKSFKKPVYKQYHRSVPDVYEKILFHGHMLQGLKEITGYSVSGMAAIVSAAPPPSKWESAPIRAKWLCDPLIIDSAFQLACLWCFEQTGNVSIPSYCDSYRQYIEHFPSSDISVFLKTNKLSRHKLNADFTFVDQNSKIIASLNGYEATIDSSLNYAFKADGIKI